MTAAGCQSSALHAEHGSFAAQWPHATSKYPQIPHTLKLKILRKDTCIKKAGLDDTLAGRIHPTAAPDLASSGNALQSPQSSCGVRMDPGLRRGDERVSDVRILSTRLRLEAPDMAVGGYSYEREFPTCLPFARRNRNCMSD